MSTKISNAPGASAGTDGNEKVKQYLDELEKKITVDLPNKLFALQRLRENMTHPNHVHCFDKEDLTWVDKDIADISKELAEYQKEFNEKSNLYNRTLADMQKTLQTRVEILNSVDEETNLCKLRPALVKMFAEKQCELLKSMEECRNKVCEI